MIDNILDFSRIEAGRKEYVFVPTSIGDIVNETYQAYGAVLDHNGFEHHLRIDPDLPRVPADRDAISRVPAQSDEQLDQVLLRRAIPGN